MKNDMENGTGYREAGIEITGFRVHGKAPVPKATIAKKYEPF